MLIIILGRAKMLFNANIFCSKEKAQNSDLQVYQFYFSFDAQLRSKDDHATV